MRYLNSFLIIFEILSVLWLKIGKVEGIIGGEYATTGKYIYTVSVQQNNVHVCGGAIVSPKNVITAAQCVIKEDNNFKEGIFTVVAGTIDLKGPLFESTKVREYVQKIYVPKEFEHILPGSVLSNHYDTGNIAVLELWSPLQIGQGSLMQLKLPKRSAALSRYSHQSAILSGFGIDDLSKYQNDFRRSVQCSQCQKLKFATAEIVGKQSCKRIITQIIHDKHLCAQMKQKGSQSAGACEGDIGSPLVLDNDTLIGILIRTTETCNERTFSAVYTKVAPFVNFILEALECVVKDKPTSDKNIRMAFYRRRGDGTQHLQEFFDFI